MKRTVLIFWAVLALLVISLIFNFVQTSKVNGANALSDNIATYLSLEQKECPSAETFAERSDCLVNLIANFNKEKEKPNFMEISFTNFYTASQTKAVLVLKNIGQTAFDPTKFRLYLNKELQDKDGCESRGTLELGQLCGLNFYKMCAGGDVLLVTYEDKPAFQKSC